MRYPPKPIVSGTNAPVKEYTYGDVGDVQANLGRAHALRVWVKRPAGWRALIYQEVMSLDAPPSFAPGAGKDFQVVIVSFDPEETPELAAKNKGLAVQKYGRGEAAAMGWHFLTGEEMQIKQLAVAVRKVAASSVKRES